MASNLNVSITDELKDFINSRTGDNGIYSTPEEYLRDLIRKDMLEQSSVSHIIKSIDDIKHKRFSNKSILDVLDED